MTRRRTASAVRAIKQRAWSDQILYSEHAWFEMQEDGLMEADVRVALLKGSLIMRQSGEMRGTRYVLRGPSLEGDPIAVVCALSVENIRIVTVFRV